jgi:hypothetical protein
VRRGASPTGETDLPSAQRWVDLSRKRASAPAGGARFHFILLLLRYWRFALAQGGIASGVGRPERRRITEVAIPLRPEESELELVARRCRLAGKVIALPHLDLHTFQRR